MSEELVTSLQSYKVQLAQVEQSLLNTNLTNAEELLKLKKDLEEVISLTQTLIEPTEERAPRSVAQYLESSTSKSQKPWKVGDRCEAYMSKENKYQVGTIKEILEDRTCCVAFGKKYCEIVQLDSLRVTKNKVDPQKEHRRQKVKKYEEKLREEEKVGEDIKNKWQAFNNKMIKNKKMKKSIFATPDSVNGKVGVGTCGMGGRPMTKFSHVEKLIKGTKN